MLPCLTKQFLGFDCMGCGLQRSALFFIKGNFIEAFHMYPGIFPLVALFGFLGLTQFFQIRFSAIIINILAISAAFTIIASYIIKLTTIF
ncbi:MAG: DUF2752 domain-containing protein [Leeuwenhoekiella sp.]